MNGNRQTARRKGFSEHRARYWRSALIAQVLLLAACAGSPDVRQEELVLPFPPPPEPARFWSERVIKGTADVAPLTRENQLKLLLTGAADKTGLKFTKPYDVAVHRGRIFVSDTVRRVVLALDYPANEWFTIGDQAGPGKLAKPMGMATDSAGNLYVADVTQQRVVLYDREGAYKSALGGKEIMDRPVGVDVSPDGSRLYVVDIGGISSDRHRVLVFDPRSGEQIGEIGGRGTGDGQFNLPRDVAIGPDGLVYVTDGGNFRVQVFDQEGRFVRSWGKAGLRYGDFARPKGVAADPRGNIYVIDTAFSNFQIFTAEGKLLLFIGGHGGKGGPGAYGLPAGIDVDEDGRIFVVDQFHAKVDVFRPAELQPWEGYLPSQPNPQAKK